MADLTAIAARKVFVFNVPELVIVPPFTFRVMELSDCTVVEAVTVKSVDVVVTVAPLNARVAAEPSLSNFKDDPMPGVITVPPLPVTFNIAGECALATTRIGVVIWNCPEPAFMVAFSPRGPPNVMESVPESSAKNMTLLLFAEVSYVPVPSNVK